MNYILRFWGLLEIIFILLGGGVLFRFGEMKTFFSRKLKVIWF